MKIPFGKNLPTPPKKELLSKLGFNLKKMEKHGHIYYLDLPESPEIRCEKSAQSFDRYRYRIFYNDLQVIFIHSRNVLSETYVYFNISASVIEEALSKNIEPLSVNAPIRGSSALLEPSTFSECSLI